MGKIETKKEQKRQAILNAAELSFLSEGYVLSSMDKIARQAEVTKQTVYRYFPSKTELFHATLKHMGKSTDEDFLTHLENPDTKEALYSFATYFIHAHMTEKHLETFRLLVSESAKAPEMVNIFFEVGPHDTQEKLTSFFCDRMDIENPEILIRLWTSMLLDVRNRALLGLNIPTHLEIEQHANAATDMLLAGLHSLNTE